MQRAHAHHLILSIEGRKVEIPVIGARFSSTPPVVADRVALQLGNRSVGPRFGEGHGVGVMDTLRRQLRELRSEIVGHIAQRQPRCRHPEAEQRPYRSSHGHMATHGTAHPQRIFHDLPA